MKKMAFIALLICCLPFGCGSMGESARMERFGQINQAYERALRMGDYRKAAEFQDPSAQAPKPDIHKIEKYKIVEYNITHMDVSADQQEITQDVGLQYFRLNGNVLHTVHRSQSWRYQPDSKTWLLQTGLPELGP